MHAGYQAVFRAVPSVAGVWCAFGHGHQGLTLGPVAGELLAAMMVGRAEGGCEAVFARTFCLTVFA